MRMELSVILKLMISVEIFNSSLEKIRSLGQSLLGLKFGKEFLTWFLFLQLWRLLRKLFQLNLTLKISSI